MSNSSVTKLRPIPREALARAFVKLLPQALEGIIGSHNISQYGYHQTCMSCLYFDEDGRKSGTVEQCTAYNSRPPARIIAFGCQNYSDADDIPF